MKQAFHCRECRLLITGNHPPLKITGREKLQDGGEYSYSHSYAHEDISVFFVDSGKQVIGADRSHREASRLNRARHRVRVLPQPPGVEQQMPEALQLERAVRRDRVSYRVLQPCVRRDDEITG